MSVWRFFSLNLAAAMCCLACAAAEPTMTPVNGYPDFAIGGDLSWSTRIIDENICNYYKTRDLSSGKTTIPEMVGKYAFDAVRLRVWVDPTGPMALKGFKFSYASNPKASYDVLGTFGYCGTEDLVRKAKMFAALGTRIMVTFHMSDTWADPARQFIPAAWSDCKDFDELCDRASGYITEVLTALHDANIQVAWVSVGNETDTGMMKAPLPSQSGMEVTEVDYGCNIASNNQQTVKNFVNMFAAGAKAAKGVYPDCKTILHLAHGTAWNKINWTLNLLRRQGFSTEICDYVGISLYPGLEDGSTDYTAQWQRDVDQALDVMANINANYGFRSIICEFGMNNEWSESVEGSSAWDNINQCNTDVEAATKYLFAHTKDDPASTCDGIFYWEPETDYLDNYKMGACYGITGNWSRKNVTANPYWYVCQENSTFPAGGLKEFSFGDGGVGIVSAESAATAEYFNLQGVRISNPTAGSLVIERRGSELRKIIVR